MKSFFFYFSLKIDAKFELREAIYFLRGYLLCGLKRNFVCVISLIKETINSKYLNTNRVGERKLRLLRKGIGHFLSYIFISPLMVSSDSPLVSIFYVLITAVRAFVYNKK